MSGKASIRCSSLSWLHLFSAVCTSIPSGGVNLGPPYQQFKMPGYRCHSL
ncbi:uncharacterized protein PpBr36_11148 [Pyricularia pennisetigena]|nr:uncharacterized protein PpBr36_11148 [Pyricularia pennisetigena]TLS20526.1 hypothetical protein PpBr36_11148 [Pyricularia pennisetigena]